MTRRQRDIHVDTTLVMRRHIQRQPLVMRMRIQRSPCPFLAEDASSAARRRPGARSIRDSVCGSHLGNHCNRTELTQNDGMRVTGG